MLSKVERPMRQTCPIVSSLNRFKSSGMCHGKVLFRPITPFWATATSRLSWGVNKEGTVWDKSTFIGKEGNGHFIYIQLYSNRGFYGWMRIVSLETDVVVAEVEQIRYFRVQIQTGKRAFGARQLQFHLFQMIQIEVRIT